MHTLTQPVVHSLSSLRLENEHLALSILPEVGAKILGLTDKKSERNLLWENPRVRPQRFPIDSNFDNYWCGGWDDAFPTADACEYKGEAFPNLGELRSLQWQVDGCGADQNRAWARLSTFAPISALRGTKAVILQANQVTMFFELECLGPLPLDYLWGTHPAFSVTEETHLLIPAKKGIVAVASHPSLGNPGECYVWPWLDGLDMSRVQGIEAGVNCGHYLTDLESGWFAVEHADCGVVFDFPLEKCPYLWLWLTYGGWRGYHHVIIEPWTGYPVNLAEAARQQRHSQLLPGKKFAVTIRCATYRAPGDALAARRNLSIEIPT